MGLPVGSSDCQKWITVSWKKSPSKVLLEKKTQNHKKYCAKQTNKQTIKNQTALVDFV